MRGTGPTCPVAVSFSLQPFCRGGADMDGITFDSLGFSKRLILAGFSQGQAEALVNLTAEMEKTRIAERDKFEAVRKEEQEKLEAERRNTLATKADIEKVRAELKTDIEKVRGEIEKVRAELKTDIEKVRAELKTDIEKVKFDLLKWQIGIGIPKMTQKIALHEAKITTKF